MVFCPVFPVNSVRDTLCFSLYPQIPQIFRIGLLILNRCNQRNLRILGIGLCCLSLLHYSSIPSFLFWMCSLLLLLTSALRSLTSGFLAVAVLCHVSSVICFLVISDLWFMLSPVSCLLYSSLPPFHHSGS